MNVVIFYNHFCLFFTWSVEMLRWSGQSRTVAVSAPHGLTSKRTVTWRFWHTRSCCKALLKKWMENMQMSDWLGFNLELQHEVRRWFLPLWFQTRFLVTEAEKQRKNYSYRNLTSCTRRNQKKLKLFSDSLALNLKLNV